MAQGDPLSPLDGTTYTTPHTHTLLATPHIALHLLACMHTIHHQACCVCMPVSMLLCLHSCVHAVSAPLPCITLAMSVCLLVLLSAVVGSFITTPLNQSDHTQSHRATHSHSHTQTTQSLTYSLSLALQHPHTSITVPKACQGDGSEQSHFAVDASGVGLVLLLRLRVGVPKRQLASVD